MADRLTSSLLRAVDSMADLAPGSTVQSRRPPETDRAHTPWHLASRFVFPRPTTYDDIAIVLRDWRDDRLLGQLIPNRRLTRIQVRYEDRGDGGEYTLAEIGPWEATISRAYVRVAIRDERIAALSERYGADNKKPSYIESLIVWFSAAVAEQIKMGKRKPKPSAKPAKKAAKKRAAANKRRV